MRLGKFHAIMRVTWRSSLGREDTPWVSRHSPSIRTALAGHPSACWTTTRASRPSAPGGARTMAADRHEALIRAFINEVFNGHRVDALEKYWDDNLTSHWLGMETIHGLPAWRAAMEGFFAAFPDAAYTLDDMFFAGDRGVWRGHWQATQQGEWQGIAASGRNVTWTVIIIGRFAGGKLIEDWVELDRLGLFQQLGCIPTGS